MHINEIENGALVEVTIKAGDKRVKFATTAVGPVPSPKPALIIEPLCNEGKLVNLKGQNYSYEILIIPQGDGEAKPLLWKQVALTLMKNAEGKMYHVIVSEVEGKQVNRRSNYRLFLGLDAIMQIDPDTKEIETFLKDVSATGFSVVCSESLKIEKGMSLTVHFHDDEGDVNFKLNGKVVRQSPIENQTSILYGCKLRTESSQVHKFVVDKQRRRTALAEKSAKQSEVKSEEVNSDENQEKDGDK